MPPDVYLTPLHACVLPTHVLILQVTILRLEGLGMRILCTLHRLKQPEYQCYRTKIGTARNIETLEQISAELKSLLLVCSQCVIVIYLQWNLSNILGGKIIVLISEMSFFQGENNGWIQSSVLVNLGILIAEVSFKRGSTVVLFVFT